MARTERADTTEPKGRATARRDPNVDHRADRWVTLQWIGVAAAIAALIAAAMYFTAGQDTRSPHSGGPAASVAAV